MFYVQYLVRSRFPKFPVKLNSSQLLFKVPLGAGVHGFQILINSFDLSGLDWCLISVLAKCDMTGF